MKFFRYERRERITLEGRKAAAFHRRQARELARYPLLAAEIAESQISIEDAEASRNAIGERSEQTMRDLNARFWKEARRDYFASDESTRQAIRTMWQGWAGPKTSTYYCYVVDLCTGEHERRSQAAKEKELAFRRQHRASIGYQQAINLESMENLTRGAAV